MFRPTSDHPYIHNWALEHTGEET